MVSSRRHLRGHRKQRRSWNAPVIRGWIGVMAVSEELQAGAMVAMAVMAGAYPALLFLRAKSLTTHGGKLKLDGGRYTVRKGLVTIQFVITVTVIIASATVYQQLAYLKSKPLGFTEDPVVVITAETGWPPRSGDTARLRRV